MSEDISHLDFEPEDPELHAGLDAMGQPKEDIEPERIHKNPRNHLELAENAGIDMSWLREQIQQERVEVFGQDALDAVEGHEASEENVQSVINAIKALTQEKVSGQEEYKFTNATKLQRRLEARDEGRHLTDIIILNYYPDGAVDASPNVANTAVVDVSPLRYGKRTIKRHGHEERGSTTDSMYVDQQTAKPMIKREVDISRWNMPQRYVSAAKEATEEEVQAALDLITKMVQEDEKQRVQGDSLIS